MNYNFLTEGNGIIACYDMYPTQFRSIEDMKNYLPKLKQYGFNALWINPLQLPGDINGFFKTDKNLGVKIGNEVTRSLYAMSNPDLINPQFSQGTANDSLEKIQQLNRDALKSFTQRARELDIVPMFDLVLNHVAIDSPLCKEKPHWFKGAHEDFKDVRGFNYDDEKIRKEIMRELWQPYIQRYMLEYGFDGVRVDAVGYVHHEIRREVYEYIHTLSKEHKKPKPVIIDEALFNKRELAEEVRYLKLPGVGPTHITTEVYNTEFTLASTDIPSKILEEEQLKASVVFYQKDGVLREQAKGGCINFCGNHDYRSLAMTILFQMAKQRFLSDPLYNDFMNSYQSFSPTPKTAKGSKQELVDPLKTTLLYSYVSQIKTELECKNEKTLHDFQTLVYEKMALTALTGSGGWFLLSGDETCDVTAKTVFQRKDAVDKSYYPQREHHIFSDKPDIANKVLEKMAEDNFFEENSANNWLVDLYHELSKHPELQQRLLLPHIENIKHQINAGIATVQYKFSSLLSAENCSIGFEAEDFIAKTRNSDNGWQGLHDNVAFISQLNSLLKKLPASVAGFSSALVRLPEKPNLVIIVRKNGKQIDAPIDIVAVNLDQTKNTILTKKDLQQIAKNYCNQYLLYGTLDEKNHLLKNLYNRMLETVGPNQIHVDSSIVYDSSEGFDLSNSSIKFFKSQPESRSSQDDALNPKNTIVKQ
ncbi:alpha-amylase [Legionella gratiana]|uniref:Alpha-amylase n=1 Tax=Legionella gratiana TaxID=45066 RepID=A0A378JBY8_9GAMM|nr:alpha-amylase family protein [Legionella gratiana]KTD06492.1 alpha-amylase [Legionella gratiana]STX45313.1 alpha-amylase [Legionella gratiana]